MHTDKNLGERVARCKHKWLQVCKTRGTPQPDNAHVANFLACLPAKEQSELDHALAMCANGREKHRELDLISWAASCTRPAYLARLNEHGLPCTSHGLFGAGLSLIASGWDMSARIAQLQQNPADIELLRATFSLQASAGATSIAPPAPTTVTAPARPLDPPIAAILEKSTPAYSSKTDPDTHFDLFVASPPMVRQTATKDADSEEPAFEHQPSGNESDVEVDADVTDGRLKLRLFGRDSAHTLEVGPHRRGAGFMGVQVVTIESARALGTGGYDWRRKLVIELTPEEMPAAMAVLMGLRETVKFGLHGTQRDKFIELRRQENGLLVVTGQAGANYAVPVRSSAVYYLLNLFCQAMAKGINGGSISDVLVLMRNINL